MSRSIRRLARRHFAEYRWTKASIINGYSLWARALTPDETASSRQIAAET